MVCNLKYLKTIEQMTCAAVCRALWAAIMNFFAKCHSWLPFSSSASLGSDARSQASCTTEYEGDVDHVPADYQKERHGERSVTPSDGHEMEMYTTDMEERDPRLPNPARVRWLKAYHRVKQIIRRVR